MNNYELHSRAQELAASYSGYNLARRFLALEEELQEARREFGQSRQSQGEPVVWWDGSTDWNPDSFTFDRTEFNEVPLYMQPAAPAAVPENCTIVPNSALRWLYGEEGEFEPPKDMLDWHMNVYGGLGSFWWRTVLRNMIADYHREME